MHNPNNCQIIHLNLLKNIKNLFIEVNKKSLSYFAIQVNNVFSIENSCPTCHNKRSKTNVSFTVT